MGFNSGFKGLILSPPDVRQECVKIFVIHTQMCMFLVWSFTHRCICFLYDHSYTDVYVSCMIIHTQMCMFLVWSFIHRCVCFLYDHSVKTRFSPPYIASHGRWIFAGLWIVSHLRWRFCHRVLGKSRKMKILLAYTLEVTEDLGFVGLRLSSHGRLRFCRCSVWLCNMVFCKTRL